VVPPTRSTAEKMIVVDSLEILTIHGDVCVRPSLIYGIEKYRNRKDI
jgi:hypothetical protein